MAGLEGSNEPIYIGRRDGKKGEGINDGRKGLQEPCHSLCMRGHQQKGILQCSGCDSTDPGLKTRG